MQAATNRLADEKSPYLLQHATNPVDWYPWGEEAFARARREQKPIFLSVGYSTCHWCHVMERECFEDPEIAQLMNEHFVNIKVDREERPDVDRVYMSYVQLTTGRGGWPMSVWLTPSLEPFFGGTYFPPRGRMGMPGFTEVLLQLVEGWSEERDRITAIGERTIDQLKRALAAEQGAGQLLDGSTLFAGFKAFQTSYDRRSGGFDGAPKFPRPVVFSFLLSYYARTGDEEAAAMVVETLRRMARGGIRDHLGGGFHRYAVDADWHLPHFEKMLYDQAQLVRCYLEAYRVSGDEELAEAARDTFDYVLRDLTSERGAFYSAEDADSLPRPGAERKAEGAFYVWSHEQLRELLGDDTELFCDHYGVLPVGNVDDPHGELSGLNVLHARRSVAETSAMRREREVPARLRRARGALFEARGARPRPHLDDKVLCAWNGMMISALARGSVQLGDESLLRAAERAAGFVLERLRDGSGRLLRRYRDGEAAIDAYLEDYAHLVEGLIDLYGASFDPRWLEQAERLTALQQELFWDSEQGGFFNGSGDDRSLLLRLKDDYDGAEPAANSVAASNLLALAALTGRQEWEELAQRTIRCFSDRLQRAPQALPRLLVAFDMLRNPPARVVIAGEPAAEDTAALLAVARAAHCSRALVMLASDELVAAYGDRLPELRSMRPVDGAAAAYVCRGRECEAPIVDPLALEERLARK